MKRTLLILALIIAPIALLAQDPVAPVDPIEDDNGDPPFRNSFFTGGSLGLQIGTISLVDVSPQFGYYPLEHISIGAGITYQYISDRRYVPRLDIHVLGGRLFTRLYLPIFESIFAHVEYEYMTYKVTDIYQPTYLEWVSLNNFLAGVGYRQRIGGRSSINLMLLWNFNESQYSLYSNPVIRMGADIGL